MSETAQHATTKLECRDALNISTDDARRRHVAIDGAVEQARILFAFAKGAVSTACPRMSRGLRRGLPEDSWVRAAYCGPGTRFSIGGSRFRFDAELRRGSKHAPMPGPHALSLKFS